MPYVPEFDQLETFCLEPFNVTKNTLSVAFCTVCERKSYGVRNLVQSMPGRKVRLHKHHVRELLFEAVFALDHVL